MNDVISVKDQMLKFSAQLTNAKKELIKKADRKAETAAEYDKVIALTLAKLRNGRHFEIDGEEIQNPPVSIMDKLAKGLCWEQSLAKEKAETGYKAVNTSIDIIKSQLNALQSVYRHLDET